MIAYNSKCLIEVLEIPLRFLIGQLHVNFTVLWPYVIEFIASYAKEMKSELFWEIFAAQLEMASKQEWLGGCLTRV